jgi:hypothetical protein
MLRGCLSAFELDAPAFERRAKIFARLLADPELWPDFTGALLATGEYQRARPNGYSFQFGTQSRSHANQWRLLLTGASREELKRTREVLAQFLDAVDYSRLPLPEALRDIQHQWLRDQEAARRYDWRYYMVKYPSMREGGSGIYYAQGGVLGYSLCMISGGRTWQTSWHRDPYLSAIWRALGEPKEYVEDPWFQYEWAPHRLHLTRSGVGLRSASNGLELQLPPDVDEGKFKTLCSQLEINDERVIVMPQTYVNGHLVDAGNRDRVQLGVAVVRQLLELGL